MSKPDPNRTSALRRLRRLAGGKINDAAILALRGNKLTVEEIAKLDLSAITEIKVPKDSGGCDVKLADPFKAVDMLLEQSKADGSSLFEALNSSAEPDDV